MKTYERLQCQTKNNMRNIKVRKFLKTKKEKHWNNKQQAKPSWTWGSCWECSSSWHLGQERGTRTAFGRKEGWAPQIAQGWATEWKHWMSARWEAESMSKFAQHPILCLGPTDTEMLLMSVCTGGDQTSEKHKWTVTLSVASLLGRWCQRLSKFGQFCWWIVYFN